jgi:electron transfer flavoprotein alpha subunit
MANSILVVGEVAEGALAPIAAQMLGGARKLAGDSGASVACVVIGSGVEAQAQEAIAFGADEAYAVDDAALAEYNSDSYAQAMAKVVEQVSPAIILFGQTDLGRDLAPRLAFRLGTGVIMDTVELAMEGDRLLGTRPCYGGSARAVNIVRGDPQIATVRAKSQEALEKDDSRQGQVTKIDAGIDAASVWRTPKWWSPRAAASGARRNSAPSRNWQGCWAPPSAPPGPCAIWSGDPSRSRSG